MAKIIERRVPDVATTTWAVKDRAGVFVDYGQNARDRTIASAYSVRPVPDARVSAPLRWDEVAGVEPEAFTIRTMAARMKEVGDLTARMWEQAVSIPTLFERVGEKPPGEGPKPRKRADRGGPWRDWRAEYQARYEERKKAARKG